jgi:hypothetical protein
MRHQSNMIHAWLGLALAACSVTALAQEQAGASDWVAVNEQRLDQMRGGFTLGSGLKVSLGLERLVAVNGEVVARTSFHVADLNHLSAEQARQTSAALSSVKLVQNGGDNINLAAMPPQALGGTVIQNSLNNQLIRSQTVINSTVNSMGLLKALNFQGSLGDALVRAVTP